MLAGALGPGCATSPDDVEDDGGAGGHAVVVDGVRRAGADADAAVAGRALHYVAIEGRDVHAFDREDDARAFAQSAAPRSLQLLPPPPLPPPPLLPPPPPMPRFFEHSNFSGCSFAVTFDLGELFTIGGCRVGWNDVISSVDTQGFAVLLREHVSFGGASLFLVGAHPSLPFWNDRASSIDIAPFR